MPGLQSETYYRLEMVLAKNTCPAEKATCKSDRATRNTLTHFAFVPFLRRLQRKTTMDSYRSCSCALQPGKHLRQHIGIELKQFKQGFTCIVSGNHLLNAIGRHTVFDIAASCLSQCTSEGL